RLMGVSIVIPPLQTRRERIPELARRFLQEIAERNGVSVPPLSEAVERALIDYSWPGNVRELRQAIERAMVLARGARLEPEHFDLSSRATVRPLVSSPAAARPAAGDLREELSGIERRRVIEALEACGGNQTQAAKRLGISRRALIHRMEAFGLPR